MVWTTSYYHLDGTHSTANITDAIGATVQSFRYDAWGNLLTLNTSTYPFLFVGEMGYYHDSFGGIYVRLRHFDSLTARFLSTDPIGVDARGNVYIYASNNPTTRVDPSGLIDFECTTDWCSELRDDQKRCQSINPTLNPDHDCLKKGFNEFGEKWKDWEVAFVGVRESIGSVAGGLKAAVVTTIGCFFERKGEVIYFCSCCCCKDHRLTCCTTLEVSQVWYTDVDVRGKGIISTEVIIDPKRLLPVWARTALTYSGLKTEVSFKGFSDKKGESAARTACKQARIQIKDDTGRRKSDGGTIVSKDGDEVGATFQCEDESIP